MSQQWPSEKFRFFYHLTRDFPMVLVFIVFAIFIGQLCSGEKPDLFGRGWVIVDLGIVSSLLGLHGLCFGRWNIRQQQLQAQEFAEQFPTYHEDLARRLPWIYWFFYSRPVYPPLVAVRIAGLVLLLMGGYGLVAGTIRWWSGT